MISSRIIQLEEMKNSGCICCAHHCAKYMHAFFDLLVRKIFCVSIVYQNHAGLWGHHDKQCEIWFLVSWSLGMNRNQNYALSALEERDTVYMT